VAPAVHKYRNDTPEVMRSSLGWAERKEGNKSVHKFALKPAKSSSRREDAHRPTAFFLQRETETAVLAFNLADAVDFFGLSQALALDVRRRDRKSVCSTEQHEHMCGQEAFAAAISHPAS
jgi:hypothetical protein